MTPRELIVLGDTTLGGFARELEAQARAAGLPWSVRDAGFDSWERELFEPKSATRGANASTLGLLLSPRVLEGERADAFPGRLRAVLEVLKALSPVRTVLCGNLFADPRTVLPLTATDAGAQRARAVNDVLREFSASHPWFYVLDHASLALRSGIAALSEPRYEALGALYFSPAGTRLVAGLWCRALRALTRTPAKVLVVDLDNVLWQGIVGEDGIDGLQMGVSGVGWFHRRFQQALLELRRAGVLLAVCSKNNPAEAQAVLREHPDCLLRPAHFAALEIGWEPKSQGLRRLAARLGLGLDSFVFIDDSAFEREEVRSALPEVTVLDFPPDPSGLAPMLEACTAFDRLRITQEDAGRAASYAAEAERESLREGAASPEEFYRSLGLATTLQRARPADFERLHQLIHKTNQFNLTSERLSAEAFRERLAAAHFEIYGMRVADRFGDSGLVGLALVDRSAAAHWRVENFLLSCRVIGRTVEHAFVSWLAERARAQGAQSLTFAFAATPRNQVAREFLERSGLKSNSDGTRWGVELADLSGLARHYVSVTAE
jgi:FkbH-like protein